MPHREYPMPRAVDQLKLAGFQVIHTKHFPIRYKMMFVNAQLHMATAGLERLADQFLAAALLERTRALKEEAAAVIAQNGCLEACRNYVIAAAPV
jgi:hypothetical protein